MTREDWRHFAILSATAAAGAIALIAALTTETKAQPVCIPWPAMKQSLEQTFHEALVGGGVTAKGAAVVQVYASADGKTFTIVLIGTNGIACGVVAGTDWQQTDMPAKGDPS